MDMVVTENGMMIVMLCLLCKKRLDKEKFAILIQNIKHHATIKHKIKGVSDQLS